MTSSREEEHARAMQRDFPTESQMPAVILDLGDPEDLGLVNGQCKWAPGLVPGAENEGLVAGKFIEAPPRLADFDDSGWETPRNIRQVVGTGFTFAWYRFTINLPEKVKGLDVAGAQIWFETVADDYGEVWVDCSGLSWVSTPVVRMVYPPAQAIAEHKLSPVSGYNALNRILITNNAEPGRRHVIACLAINGPLAQPIGGVFLRYARLEICQSRNSRIPVYS